MSISPIKVRYMLLVDVGTQWFTKLARIEVETSYEPDHTFKHDPLPSVLQ